MRVACLGEGASWWPRLPGSRTLPMPTPTYAMKHDAVGLTPPELGDSGATTNGTCAGFIETSMLAG